MSGNALTHPEREILSAFGLGKLPPEEAREVEEHITECEPCCRTLLDLQGDTFVELVRSSNAENREHPQDALPHDVASSGPTDKPGVNGDEAPPELVSHPKYRTVVLLGRGGMGDVYTAEHRLMNRVVALKVIHRDLLAKPTVVERFRREVQAAAQLSHPNIVTAYDAEHVGEAHFLVLEYVDGADLAAYVKQQGSLSVEVACDFICQAAAGLQHAHDCGMVHRDIKPHNLMVTVDGRVKILDFGLASLANNAEAVSEANTFPRVSLYLTDSSDLVDSESTSLNNRLTHIGCTMGTPDFISPEQASDAHAADARSDIYSLGCTLYFLLAGNPPFAEGSAAAKLDAHSRRTPPPIEHARDDIPQQLADAIHRMLAKDPADRFQTPNELAAALAPFAMSQPPAKLVAPAPRDNVSSRRRLRWISAISVIAMAALATVVIIRMGQTTIRFEIDDPNVAVHFGRHTITANNDDQTLHITPGEQQAFVVVRADRTEVIGRSFQLAKGQQVVLRVTNAKDGRFHVAFNESESPLSEITPPEKFRHVAKVKAASDLKHGVGSPATRSNPNINASREFPGVFHSPSADSTPPEFRSIFQLEVVTKRGDGDAQVEYANGTVVSKDGLIVSVLNDPSVPQDGAFRIESATILRLDGASAAATVVAYKPAYGVAVLRAKELKAPPLQLSPGSLVANRRVTWRTVYKNGRKTYLYTRQLRIHQARHEVAGVDDLCQVIDASSSALSAERSGSALIALDGTLLAVMGRQTSWQVSLKGSPQRKKLGWAVPAQVIARLIDDADGR